MPRQPGQAAITEVDDWQRRQVVRLKREGVSKRGIQIELGLTLDAVQQVLADAVQAGDLPSGPPPGQPVGVATPPPRPVEVCRPVETPNSLVERGEAHEDATVRRLAEKARRAMEELTAALRDYEEIARQREAIRREVEQLTRRRDELVAQRTELDQAIGQVNGRLAELQPKPKADGAKKVTNLTPEGREKLRENGRQLARLNAQRRAEREAQNAGSVEGRAAEG
jgi:hypothetical protein